MTPPGLLFWPLFLPFPTVPLRLAMPSNRQHMLPSRVLHYETKKPVVTVLGAGSLHECIPQR